MTECAKEWIGIALELSGEMQVTRGVLEGAIEMIENSLNEFGDEDDSAVLYEIEELLHHSE